MKKKILFSILALSLSGCAINKPIVHTLQSSYDPKEVSYSKKQGANIINGNAFMRQLGGGVVTCAGQEVFLSPISNYAKERITFLYNNENGGISPYHEAINKKFDKTDEAYVADQKKTICNSEGKFTFKNVADGEYYVGTGVFWVIANMSQGGQMARKISVNGGETLDIILSN